MKNIEMFSDTKHKVIVYGTPVCPMVPPVLGMLRQAHVPYEYINIHSSSTARVRVREINHGYESVPTLEFPDGTTLTEPSVNDLKRRLETMGYSVGLLGMLYGHLPKVIIAAGVLLALMRALNVI